MELRKIWLLINCIVILLLVILSILLMIIIMLVEMDKQMHGFWI